MDDEEMNLFYSDPANRAPAGPLRPRRRSKKPLTSHVPIRFSADVIAQVQRLAEDDRRTVSSWIRGVVETEIARRAPDRPDFVISGCEIPQTWTA